MLQKLQVQNYAIIDQVVVNFSDKLTIITGETGAGKSILLGALSLILGNRATNNVFRNPDKKCIIEGCFDIRERNLQAFFEQYNLDYENETIIRREITPSGKSRTFINDTPVTLSILNQLAEQLINLHAQHQNLYLNNKGYQLQIIDGVAEQLKEVDKYRKDFNSYVEKIKKLQNLKAQNQQLLKELDYINFQLEELENAALEDPNEQIALETELKQLENAEFIQANLRDSAALLGNEESSLVQYLEVVEKNLNKIAEFGKEYEQLNDRFKSVAIEVNDIYGELQHLSDSVEHNPERTHWVQDRLNMILRLQNKHQLDSIAELQALYLNLSDRKAMVNTQEKDIEVLAQQCDKLQVKLMKQAKKISKKRQKAIPILEGQINKMLKQMEMKEARIEIALEVNEKLSVDGLDEVAFLFAANRGSQAVPLKKVASGGELSRLMLAIQSLLASTTHLPTLIFDEIDTGISGEVAIKVGKLLKRLSKNHQLICITHLPQIASIGDTHYKIYKEHTGTKTISQIERLDNETRVEEIGTILSGAPPSEEAKANARHLMEMMKEG